MQYLRDNAGVLESSTNGTDWAEVYKVGATELVNSYFVPPFVTQATEPTDEDPCLENTYSLCIWHNTGDSKTYLMVNDNGTIKKIELT